MPKDFSPLTPRKRFGQHFLHDISVIQKIITAINPHPPHAIVEIGAGQGALTFALLKFVDELDAIELDRDLVSYLHNQHSSKGKLHIHSADVLKFDFNQLVKDEKPLRIVGNLPYNISTQLLFYLLNFVHCISDITVMLQKEVVNRMIAQPNTSEYGRLSVMLQYHYDIKKLFEVSPNAFYPKPKVDSSVVHLMPYRVLPVQVLDSQNFSHIVSCAFSQRRKMLRNTLKTLITDEEMKNLAIDPNARPESLTVLDFVHLANCFTKTIQN
jgi:16S rRNA (adenine1518-N6/adenine1519-N6)-dimethyltransferase